MKKYTFLTTITIFAYFCCLQQSAEALMETEIEQFLKELSLRMCHPFPKYGLPALDPLHIQHLNVSMNNKYLIDFTASVTDFNLTGLSDFIINDLRIRTDYFRRSSVNVTMPLTGFKSIYKAKGSLAYILNMNGEGNALAEVESIEVVTSWLLKVGLKLGIKDFSLTIKVGKIFINFENLFEEERINEFFHALINELGLELIDDIWKVENGPVEKIIENVINEFIGQYTLTDIMKWIASSGDGPIFGDIPADCKKNSNSQRLISK